jgi:hypothetical protein
VIGAEPVGRVGRAQARAEIVAVQPKGADASPQAFGAYYDSTQKALSAALGSSASSPTRLMTLYSAWIKAQSPGVDTSPDAFTRYLEALSQQPAA